MREPSEADNHNRSLEGLEWSEKVSRKGRLCTRPLRKGWILQVKQVRQDIPREGKQPGQGLEVKRRVWEGGGERTGLPGAEWACGTAWGLCIPGRGPETWVPRP